MAKLVGDIARLSVAYKEKHEQKLAMTQDEIDRDRTAIVGLAGDILNETQKIIKLMDDNINGAITDHKAPTNPFTKPKTFQE